MHVTKVDKSLHEALLNIRELIGKTVAKKNVETLICPRI